MTPGETHPHLLLAIVATSLALMLLRPRRWPEVVWIGGGVGVLLALRLVTPAAAVRAVARGLDVYLFLAGMMVLSELARVHGVFDWLSAATVRAARGSSSRLFALVYAAGTLVTIFLSNDATAVVLTPAILAASRNARVAPLPHLFACAMIANAASFVLPISNPANLVVFADREPPLGLWLRSFGLPSLLSIGATFLALRWWFREPLRARIEGETATVTLPLGGKVVLVGLALMVVVLLTFSTLGHELGAPTAVLSAALALAASLPARKSPLALARDVSWGTLLLVAGLFVMVDAVVSVGALRVTNAWLAAASAMPPWQGALATGFGVGIANNLVNNLPLGLLAGATLQAAHTEGLLAQAVLIGVDLGPNLSLTGSLATILWLLALRKEGVEVGFWQFLRVGALVMTAALAAALGGAVLTHVLL